MGQEKQCGQRPCERLAAAEDHAPDWHSLNRGAAARARGQGAFRGRGRGGWRRRPPADLNPALQPASEGSPLRVRKLLHVRVGATPHGDTGLPDDVGTQASSSGEIRGITVSDPGGGISHHREKNGAENVPFQGASSF